MAILPVPRLQVNSGKDRKNAPVAPVGSEGYNRQKRFARALAHTGALDYSRLRLDEQALLGRTAKSTKTIRDFVSTSKL